MYKNTPAKVHLTDFNAILLMPFRLVAVTVPFKMWDNWEIQPLSYHGDWKVTFWQLCCFGTSHFHRCKKGHKTWICKSTFATLRGLSKIKVRGSKDNMSEVQGLQSEVQMRGPVLLDCYTKASLQSPHPPVWVRTHSKGWICNINKIK